MSLYTPSDFSDFTPHIPDLTRDEFASLTNVNERYHDSELYQSLVFQNEVIISLLQDVSNTSHDFNLDTSIVAYSFAGFFLTLSILFPVLAAYFVIQGSKKIAHL